MCRRLLRHSTLLVENPFAVVLQDGDLGVEAQGAEEFGSLSRDSHLGKHDDREEITRRQYPAEAEDRLDSIGLDELSLCGNISAPLGHRNVEDIVASLVQVAQTVRIGLDNGVELETELMDQIGDHGKLAHQVLAGERNRLVSC